MSLSYRIKSPQRRSFQGAFIRLDPVDITKDAEDLYRISHQSEKARELWQFLPFGPYSGVADLKVFLEEWNAKADAVAFTVRDSSNASCLGTISLISIRPEHAAAELGNIWYAPEAQGTKANTEASYLLLNYCFEELKYRRMEWKCNARNERSHCAALRLGFSYEGLFRQHMIVKGENRDTAWFSMLDHEWPPIKEALSRWLYTDNSTPLRELTRALNGKK